jgi:hypothetical protein
MAAQDRREPDHGSVRRLLSRPHRPMKRPPASQRAMRSTWRRPQLVVDRARCTVHPKLLGQGRGRPRAGRRCGGDRDGGADSNNRGDRGVRNLSKHDGAPSVLCWRLCHDLNMEAFRGRFRDEHHRRFSKISLRSHDDRLPSTRPTWFGLPAPPRGFRTTGSVHAGANGEFTFCVNAFP